MRRIARISERPGSLAQPGSGDENSANSVDSVVRSLRALRDLGLLEDSRTSWRFLTAMAGMLHSPAMRSLVVSVLALALAGFSPQGTRQGSPEEKLPANI